MAKKKNVLTAKDLLSSGAKFDEIDLTDELDGVVYIRPLKAGEVLDFIETDESKRNAKMLGVIASVVVDAEGGAVFSETDAERLRDMRMDVYNKIASKVTEKFQSKATKGDDEGNASAMSDASLTA